VTTPDGARAWVHAWMEGWARQDPGVIAARYAPGCRFRSQPFRAEGRGPEAVIDYTSTAFAQERTSRFAFAEPIVGSDGRAAVEYRAVLTASGDGTTTTIAGVSVLRFDSSGLVTEHFDCWAEALGDLGIEIHPEDRR
jgi:SnoaL-like protein